MLRITSTQEMRRHFDWCGRRRISVVVLPSRSKGPPSVASPSHVPPVDRKQDTRHVRSSVGTQIHGGLCAVLGHDRAA